MDQEALENVEGCVLNDASYGELLPTSANDYEQIEKSLGGCAETDVFGDWFCLRCLHQIISYPSTTGSVTYERVDAPEEEEKKLKELNQLRNCPYPGRRTDVSVETTNIVQAYPLSNLQLVLKLRKP